MAIKLNNKIINLNKIKQADLVVGIPSYNEADNIAYVVKQVDKGLVKYFGQYKSVIINVDNNSSDGTKEEFLNVKTKNPKIYISTPPGVKGKGNNFYNLFNHIIKLNAKASVAVDADLRSIAPKWMELLFKPILNGYDYVAPYYSRCEYDGSITNHICYPLIYGLFGCDIRQPIGGDFAFSTKLVKYWLKQKWHKTTKQYGIDIFMTMNAVLGDFKIAQAGLGAKIHKPSAPKLGPMFSQVVITLFKIMITNKEKWVGLDKKRKIDYFGIKEFKRPQTLSVDYKAMKSASIFNFNANEEILKHSLSNIVFENLKKQYDEKKVRINEGDWVKIIYDVFYAYDKRGFDANLIEALKPLYFGRFISFFKSTLDKDFKACEERIHNQAKLFLKDRDYLVKKY